MMKLKSLLFMITLSMVFVMTSCANHEDVIDDEIKNSENVKEDIDEEDGELKNYEKVYRDLIISEDLKRDVAKIYEVKSQDEIYYEGVEAALYDVDKDDIPELLLCIDVRSNMHVLIYGFEDGKAEFLYNSTEEAGMGVDASNFSRDKTSGELYIKHSYRYFLDIYRFEKNKEPHLVSHYVSSSGGEEEAKKSHKESGFDESQLEYIGLKPIKELKFMTNVTKSEGFEQEKKLNQGASLEYKYEDVDLIIFDLNEFTDKYGKHIGEERVEEGIYDDYYKTLTYSWGNATFVGSDRESYRLVGFDTTKNLVGVPRNIKIGDSTESVINKFRNDGHYDDIVYFEQLGPNEKLLYQSDYTNGPPSMGIIRYDDKGEASEIEYSLDYQTGAINRISIYIKDNKVYRITIFFGQT